MGGSAEPAPPAARDGAVMVAPVSPGTKPARHAQIAAILGQPGPPVRSQEELAERLAQRGVGGTQAPPEPNRPRQAHPPAPGGRRAPPVRSQEELAERLAQRGVRVTQAT